MADTELSQNFTRVFFLIGVRRSESILSGVCFPPGVLQFFHLSALALHLCSCIVPPSICVSFSGALCWAFRLFSLLLWLLDNQQTDDWICFWTLSINNGRETEEHQYFVEVLLISNGIKYGDMSTANISNIDISDNDRVLDKPSAIP